MYISYNMQCTQSVLYNTLRQLIPFAVTVRYNLVYSTKTFSLTVVGILL